MKTAGFKSNPSKAVLMTDAQEDASVLEGRKLNRVEESIYLEQSISFDRPTKKEIDRRISLNWRKFRGFKFIFKSDLSEAITSLRFMYDSLFNIRYANAKHD